MTFLETFRRFRGHYVLVFVIVFSIATYIQLQPVMGDPDGFYHAKMAEFLLHGTVLHSMPWMQFTTLRESFTDHHLLYHLLLVPFVALGKPLLGVKLATVVFLASFFTVFYWTLRRLHGAAPMTCTFILLLSSSFVFRLSLVKANSLSLILFLLLLVAALELRPVLLALLTGVYVWLYGGWPLAWVIVTAVILARIIRHFFHKERLHWWHYFFRHASPARRSLVVVGALVGGTAAGLLLNPYWPHNLQFYLQQVWEIAILNRSPVSVGGEWSSLTWYELGSELSWIMVPGVVAAALSVASIRKLKVRSITTGILALLFVAFTLKSRRYIELSAPTIMLWMSCVLADCFPPEFIDRVMLTVTDNSRSVRKAIAVTLASLLIAFTVAPGIGFVVRAQTVRSEIGRGIALDKYERVSRWLAAHTPQGSTVLHSDWDDWPTLFYFNDHNYYIVGLDPTFMYNFDPALYASWAALTAEGRVDTLVTLVVEKLRSRYVLIEKDHEAFNSLLASNIYFRLIYEDDQVRLYEFSNERTD